jgi:hypothetical protein
MVSKVLGDFRKARRRVRGGENLSPKNFMYCYQAASLEERAKIKALWEQAGLGLFLFDEGIKQSEERSS